SGFVGGYLLAQCRMRYPDAQLFGLTHPDGATTATLPLVPLVADMTQPQQVREAIATARPDLVFHLAAQPSVAASWGDPMRTLAINAGGAIHLFEALRAERLAPRIVLVGSGEQYGLIRPEENPIREECLPRPANPYAVSKVAQDLYGYQYYVAYGLPIVRVRPFNHFGPRQNEAFVIASFARQIARIEAGQAEQVLLVGNLEAQRDFLPVEDVVRAYIAIADSGHPGEAYNVGSGQARSIQQVLDALLALASVPIEVRTDPTRLRPADVPLLVADTARVREHTGWTPRDDIDAALRRTLDYWRQVVAEARTSS
ncbi:MAG TPA: GDP-mannose 4,6-dehydratase, partial [Ktedonobacterales bacterium]|nr:GDP-mannose 4,6-dehydratase [Ktedonobacterales bacterium]